APTRSRAVWLLPIRADHVGQQLAGDESASERCRHQCCDGREYLPLRNLRSHPRGHQARRGVRVMTALVDPRQSSAAVLAGTPANRGRRAVLKAGVAAGGSLLLAFYLPLRQSAAAQAQARRFEPNAFIRVDKQGVVTLVMPQVEMGQGIYTSIAMILAEELDAAIQ